MKTKLIITASLFVMLAVFTASFVTPVYSQGDDPNCANCTKTTCDESCKGVCTSEDKGNCSESLINTENVPTNSGVSSATETKSENRDNSCSDCNGTSCSYMNSLNGTKK